jgi:hypothetical protein
MIKSDLFRRKVCRIADALLSKHVSITISSIRNFARSCLQRTVGSSETSCQETPACPQTTNVCVSQVLANPACQSEGR